MVKSFKQHVADSSLHPAFEKELTGHADQTYQGAEPDLPKHGNYHFAFATDHVAGMLFDKYHKHFKNSDGSYTGGNHFQRIAHKVVSRYTDDDTKESKANDKKRERAYAKSLKPKKEKVVKVKNWDDHKPFTRARKGTGSY